MTVGVSYRVGCGVLNGVVVDMPGSLVGVCVCVCEWSVLSCCEFGMRRVCSLCLAVGWCCSAVGRVLLFSSEVPLRPSKVKESEVSVFKAVECRLCCRLGLHGV